MENKDKPKNLKKDKKEANLEFKYIDEVPKENLQGNCIIIDPGKRSLLTMMDDSGKFFSYTNRQYLKETKRLKYHAFKTKRRNRNYQGRGRT
jgi:transposase